MTGKKRRKASGKSKGKGKARQKDVGEGDEDADALLAEEITALSAIFQDDFSVISDPGHAVKVFSINLRPHSDFDGDFAAQLLVRCLPGYPWKPPKLQIVTDNKALEAESRILHAMLVEQAASISREGRVMVFNLAEVAQEFFSECLAKLALQQKKEKDSIPRSNSFLRDSAALESLDDHPSTDYVYCDLWGEDDGTWEGPDATHFHLEDSREQASRLRSSRPKPLILPEASHQNVQEIQVGVDALQLGVKGSIESSQDTEEEEEAGELFSKDHTASVTEFLHKVRAGLFKVGRAMKHSVLLDRSPRTDQDGSGEISACSQLTQDDAILSIQKDLILAYLLRLVCGKRGPLPDTLPILASQLSKLGILPSWAEELVGRPPLFEATFKRIFGQNTADVFEFKKNMESFWNASPDLITEANANSGATSSRYLSDFEELRLLGKGGFGHVVLCVNKLDGRKYAMKKVRLKDKNPSDKILREVATLSRLQHQHVVRYYQAWFETGIGDVGGTANSEAFESSVEWIDTANTTSNFHNAVSSTFLYIQMEFCPRTLREVFDTRSVLDKDSVWGIFRQIVEGLAHIHGQGIIHRDLTPSNIFFDARNDVKIGDFGLAKFTDLENPEDDVQVIIETKTKSVEGTGQVGTYFYRAPEIEQAWPHIDEKVDMYSLGVILFELWHPFSTAMERYVILNQLKQESMLPSDWVIKFPQQAALVQRLISPHPHDRPSARDVLKCELLPPRMEDEALNDIIRTIQSADDSFVFDQVIAVIFDEERIALKAENMDTESLSRDRDFHTIIWLKAQARLIELAKEVFILHGAHHFQSSNMDVVIDIKRSNRSAVKVIDSSGSMLELRYDTRRAFAQWVIANQCTSWKRYEISNTYRKSVGHRAPKEYLQGDFDIVGGFPGLAEAEAIKVAVEIISKIPSIEEYEIRLNHYQISNAIWKWSGVTKQQRKSVAQILGTMTLPRPQSSDRGAKWKFVRPQLLQGLHLPEAVVDRLGTAERRFTGNADEVLARLRGALSNSLPSMNAIEELLRLLSYLRVWLVEKLVMVDVFMVPAEHYFNGIFFQICLPKGSHPGMYSQGMLAAVGGRYDSLLEQFPKDYRLFAVPGAVGFTIALQKLVYILAQDSKNEQATEVLVCSRGGGGLLKERMEVANELWAANVKANFMYATSPSLTEQYEYAHENGIKWLVIITESGLSQSGLVKVRHLDLKREVEVERDRLGKFLSEKMSGPLNAMLLLRHGS